MIVGVPREIKSQENRVGLVPGSVREVIRVGGTVLVERNAGLGIGITDADYRMAGAQIVDTADEVFDKAELIIKVKEPLPIECKRLREGQTIFTYLHLAPDPHQTRLLKQSLKTMVVCRC